MNSNQSSRGRGRGRGSGSGSSSRSGRTNYSSNSQSSNSLQSPRVPRIFLLHPGTPVSIVLKQDQGSGREVQGFVGELLTRGDHPRGVKVRLRDGRVGRVQRIVSQDEAESASRGLEGLGENGESGGGALGRGRGRGRGRGGSFLDRRYTDFRSDGLDESSAASSSAGASLEDYIVVKGNRKEKKGMRLGVQEGEGNNAEIGGEDGGEELNRMAEGAGERRERGEEVFRSEMSICPVCEEFEGDELAVAHHVNVHFE